MRQILARTAYNHERADLHTKRKTIGINNNTYCISEYNRMNITTYSRGKDNPGIAAPSEDNGI
jgi:hypothetical protein